MAIVIDAGTLLSSFHSIQKASRGKWINTLLSTAEKEKGSGLKRQLKTAVKKSFDNIK